MNTGPITIAKPSRQVVGDLTALGRVDAALGVMGTRRYEQLEDFVNPASDDPGTDLPAPLGVDFIAAESNVDFLDDAPTGRINVQTLTNVGGAGAAQITFGNQRILSLARPGFVECDVLPSYGAGSAPSADERYVFGICTDHTNAEDPLDGTTVNAWFRIEGSTALLIEGDDGTTDVDDFPTGEVLAEGVIHQLRLWWGTDGVVHFVYNGREVGQINMSAVANPDAAGLVQIISCYQRDAGTDANTMTHDYMHWGNERESAQQLVE